MSSAEMQRLTNRRPLAKKFIPGCVLAWVGGLVVIFNCPGLSGCFSPEPRAEAGIALSKMQQQYDEWQREYTALGGGVADRLSDAWNSLPLNQQQRLNELRALMNRAEPDLWEAQVKAQAISREPSGSTGSIFWTLAGLGVAALGARGVWRSYQLPSMST